MSVLRLPPLLTFLFFSVVLIGSSASQSPSPTIPENVTLEAAESLSSKIVAIRTAEASTSRNPRDRTSVSVSDAEMESFVFYSMRDEIPARVESIDVTLSDGAIAAETRLTFDSQAGSTNPIVDLLMRSPHSIFVRGALEGNDGFGRFRLEQVRVDGFPVPLLVVEILVDRFVKPRYPQVDLDEEFRIPWGIEGIALTPEGAEITY